MIKNIFNKSLSMLAIVALISIGSVIKAQNTPPAGAQPTNDSSSSDSANKAPTRFDYGQVEDESLKIDKKSYESTLYKVSIDTFESGGNFTVSIPGNLGTAFVLSQPGVPNGLKNSKEDSSVTPADNPNSKASENKDNNKGSNAYFINEDDKKSQILGVKVNLFGGRKVSWFRINSVQPVPLAGMVKGFQFWAVGRSTSTKISIIIEDIFGREQVIPAGNLNFEGWRKLTAQVPVSVLQESFGRSARGVVFKGFLVEFNLKESSGTHYFYFDNLSAELSRYTEENRLSDNPQDNW